ncbi:MAG: DsbA family protein [Acidimicrobiales bacterium]
MARTFSVNWDYRCPFARNAHEHVLAGLRAGADWDVDFVPYSLSQGHREEGEPPVWDDPAKASDLLAMVASLAVREKQPDRFLEVHAALFRARHDQGRDLRREEVVREVLGEAGADAGAALAEVASGWPLDSFRKAHEASEADYDIWGVPTFVLADRAAFVRLMTRPTGDASASIDLIERVVGAVGGWPEVNELKHTTLER